MGIGILGRGYWTPDEPREADIAWRMSWQPSQAVPLLAGDAFCEKPPLTYWVAGAAIRIGGDAAWVARLPNLLYALVTALAIGMIALRAAGPMAGLAAAAAISTFLLSYQVAIWLATDAPLLAAVAAALLGLYVGFYAPGTRDRLCGYSCMHVALAIGFLSKSAAAWMVPVLSFAALTLWERRWREWLRWELYLGLLLQAALVLTWVWVVYVGPDGPAHLKVFFWNNLVGRFAHVDAPEEFQYAAAHRNAPGKYLMELPVYLWPWTLLAIAAARSAWRQRQLPAERQRLVRFAAATFVPTLAVLSVAATARNIYLAPALPGIALLSAGWVAGLVTSADEWDRRAVRATAAMLALATAVGAAAVILIGWDSWAVVSLREFVGVSVAGLAAAVAATSAAWRAAGSDRLPRALAALLLAYCALLVGPASQIYHRVDDWQNLASIGRAIRHDAAARPLILFTPDETTRAFVDMYTRTAVEWVPGPVSEQTTERLRVQIATRPQSLVLTQLPGRNTTRSFQELAAALGIHTRSVTATPAGDEQEPSWASRLRLHIAYRYALPNGRRYALLSLEPVTESR